MCCCTLCFRGVILIGNEGYGLEPVLHSKANKHLLFLLKDGQSEPFVCGLANETSPTEDHSHYADMSMFLRVRKFRIVLNILMFYKLNICYFIESVESTEKAKLTSDQIRGVGISG